MKEETIVNLQNWTQQVSSLLQEICIQHKMPFHADTLAAHTRALYDSLGEESIESEEKQI